MPATRRRGCAASGCRLERQLTLPLAHRREHPDLLALAAEFRAMLGSREAA
jgi:hypothetical protein